MPTMVALKFISKQWPQGAECEVGDKDVAILEALGAAKLVEAPQPHSGRRGARGRSAAADPPPLTIEPSFQ